MKQIKHRRRRLRIGNPVGFSLFCLGVIALVVLLYAGIAWVVKNGPTVVDAVKGAVQGEVNASADPSDSALPALVDEYSPSPTPQGETPQVGTPDTAPETPSAEPTQLVTAPPQEDTSAPLYGRIVGLDPCRDGSSNYPEEAVYNLEFVLKLKDYLEEQGATVILGRTDSTGTYENVDRAKTFKNAECEVVIRIMANHITSKTSAAYVRGTQKNEDFCRAVLDGYIEATGMSRQTGDGKKNGYQVKSDDVCKKCGCPCAVLIVGNWDNSTDYENLQSSDFQRKMMEGIYNGILQYFGVTV